MGKSIRSKRKRKFRAIKRDKNDDFETNRIRERYVKLQVRMGKSEEEVRTKLTEDMATCKVETAAANEDVEVRRKAIAKLTLQQLKDGDATMVEDEEEEEEDEFGVDDAHPFGQNRQSARRNGPRGKGAKKGGTIRMTKTRHSAIGTSKKSLKKTTHTGSVKGKRGPAGLKAILKAAMKGGPMKKKTTMKAMHSRRNPGR